MDSVYNFIDSLNLDGKCIVIAVSGGADSMFLLNTMINLKENKNLKIVVAHVHHNLRKESDYEATMVEKYCKENKIIFEYMKIEEYPNNKFSEAIARNIRYSFFDKLMKKYNSNFLFTAHHGDDLVETVLMKIIRGSSIEGYAGFKQISSDRGYNIVRPLIYLTKEEIEKYLVSKKLWYALDKSNYSDKYKRNRIRMNILPYLKKEDKNVHLKFLKYSNKLLKLDEYVNKVANNIYCEIFVNNKLDILKFNALDDIIKTYVLSIYLNNIYKGNISKINDKHINTLISIISLNQNKKITLPCNYIGYIEYNKFYISKKNNNFSYDLTFIDKVNLPNGHTIKNDISEVDNSNYVIHLNSKDIILPFHVRNKRNGDRMSIKNFIGTKSVSDIFTDFKLSKEERYTYPIVTDNDGKIIWIPGVKKSNFDRKKDGKYDIILKYN